MSICQSNAMFSLSGGKRYKIYHLKQHFSPPATAWRVTKMKQVVSKIRKLWSKLILTWKGSKYGKNKQVYAAILSDYFI